MATILVVDDEPAVRLLVRAALEDAGHVVVEASDGHQGLDLAERERPDLILLDVALPRLSGPEVCRRLRENPHTSSCPVLVLSGLGESGVEPADVAGRIDKPFAPRALISEVAEALALAS